MSYLGIEKIMKTLFKTTLIVISLLVCQASAHNKVVVIPMAGDDLKPLSRIITVAKQNGDFSDPVAALNSIDRRLASRDNPYLIVIAPGVYTITQPLRLQQYVDIAGSGRDITRIVGAFSDTSLSRESAMVTLDSNFSTLRDITIVNIDRTNNFTTGIYNRGILSLINVDILVQGGVNHTGAFNRNGLTIDRSEIIVNGGLIANTGIDGPATVRDSRISVSGVDATAFKLDRFRTVDVNNSLIFAELPNRSGGTIIETNLANRARAFIRNSTVRGDFMGDNNQCFGAFESTFSGSSLLSDECL